MGHVRNLCDYFIGLFLTWWGQNLSLHPHLHCIVPGGGMNKHNRWERQVRSSKYLFSVKAMSKVFRAKYVAELRKHKIQDQALLDSLFTKEWVVYAKRPFGGPAQVIEYLGRYSHKVAISNHRIRDVTADHVTFTYKDYRQGSRKKEMQLSNEEFVRRFAQHILPYRFVRIRHYGILSSSWKRGKLQRLQKLLGVERPSQEIKTRLHKCPCCKVGNLILIHTFGVRGPPQAYLSLRSAVPVLQTS